MEQAAQDDAERQRIRAELYAPPRAVGRSRGADGRLGRRPGYGMGMQQAQAMMAQIAAEDARYSR